MTRHLGPSWQSSIELVFFGRVGDVGPSWQSSVKLAVLGQVGPRRMPANRRGCGGRRGRRSLAAIGALGRLVGGKRVFSQELGKRAGALGPKVIDRDLVQGGVGGRPLAYRPIAAVNQTIFAKGLPQRIERRAV